VAIESASLTGADLSTVIPGSREAVGPESIITALGYGFRARAFGAPRN